ncbi:anti sigma factor C-terminal domain-containing protein [Brevibacillus reuszeri]|uniref:anti sigma factor C-terminal domain-containing protein n=1 Tax=Brevibacillus reuszeri TaxID=54915 RepID=UPI000CCC76C0|nr:anti sigma factor C-terminal domain-containing protein [Brevibacillus reuszeri]
MEDDKLLKDWQEPTLQWDEKKARRMVWKARFTLWRNIIHILLIIWFLYALYMMAIQIGYKQLGKEETLVRYATTLIETHYSGLKVGKWERPTVELSPWLTQETTMPLYKQIGKWELVVGSVTVKKPFWGEMSYQINYQQKELDDRDGTFKFALPRSLTGDSPIKERKEQERIWDQLKHISDGYVAEMALSSINPQTPEQMRKLLSKYDVSILQMPVYAGELKTFEPSHSRGDETYVPFLVLRPEVLYDEESRLSQTTADLTESVESAEKQFIPDLEYVLANGESRFEIYDEPRLAYLKKHGITVYGALVTGPVRELEKLRQDPEFHEFRLGRIEVWNW